MSEYDPFVDGAPPTEGAYSDAGKSLDPPKTEEPEPLGSDYQSLHDLADQRSAEERPVVDRHFLDGETGEQADPSRPVSARYAAEALAARRDAEAQELAGAVDEAVAQAVDDYRGTAPEVQPQVEPVEQPQPESYTSETPSELDQLLAGVAPENKQKIVRDLQQYVGAVQAEAQSVAAQYEQAVAQTMLRAEALLLSQAPEIASVPREQRLLALDILEKQNPQRAAQIRALDRQLGAHLQAEAQHLQAAQQRQVQVHEQQRAQMAQAFQQWGAAQDATVDKLLATETPERRYAIQQEAAAILREDGMTDAQIGFLWQNDSTFRSATAQKMLLREAKSRLAARGVHAARVTPPAPRVVRPGTTSDEGRDYSQYAEVSREMRGKDLSVKDATRLLLAKRASR